MRSLNEIEFRLRQEAVNLYLLWRQPGLAHFPAQCQLKLPDLHAIAKALRGTGYANQVEALASEILKHRFPLLGIEISTAQQIRWRRDYVHGKESELKYFKRVPYLNFQQVGDHKVVWEINRHQHLVLLAQAFVLTGRREFLGELTAQLTSWMEQNPFQQGINWASALEVAFRTLSWIWILHLAGEQFGPALRTAFTVLLYQHGLHLAANLSIYFSPNTHLLGEAVALFTLATLLPDLPGAQEWARISHRIVLEQSEAQVKPDGSHFEQSTYYHVYAVDFFLLFYVVAGRPHTLEPVLRRMAEYLSWLLGPAREIEFFGDDDGGRLFHPYGSRSRFGRATLATCGVLFGRSDWAGTADELAEQAVWWLGPECLSHANSQPKGVSGSRVFQDSGSVFLSAGEFRLQMDCGTFGFGGAGHSHSDALSITLRRSGEPVLIDPGTYTYISDIEERNRFRGSGLHNTVRIDRRDQAESVNPFRWAGKPHVVLRRCRETAGGWLVEAACEYHGFQHCRQVLLNPSRLLVLDTVEGPPEEHLCEQIWQLGPGAQSLHLSLSGADCLAKSSFSPAYGLKVEGLSRTANWRGLLPATLVMRLTVEPEAPLDVAEVTSIFQKLS